MFKNATSQFQQEISATKDLSVDFHFYICYDASILSWIHIGGSAVMDFLSDQKETVDTLNKSTLFTRLSEISFLF